MALFYVCHPRDQSVILQPKEDFQLTSLLCASKLVSKAALKLSDISTKLQMGKVARYLEQKHSEWQILSKQFTSTNNQSNEVKYISGCSLMPQTPSILNINTCKSLVSQESIDCHTFSKDQGVKKIKYSGLPQESHLQNSQKENTDKSLIGKFKWRQVVTKNILEESDQNKVVKFKDCLNFSQDQIQEEKNIKQQHTAMKQCIETIFKYFQQQNLIQLPKKSKDLKIQSFQQLSKQIFQNYNELQNQQESTIKSLVQTKNSYFQSLNKLILKLRISQTPTPQRQISFMTKIQKSSQQYLEKIENKITQLQEEIIFLKQSQRQRQKQVFFFQNQQEAIKKYQMILFIKEEQINSLKVINQNLQNRLSALAKLQERPRSRSYKKYFQDLDQGLRATVA